MAKTKGGNRLISHCLIGIILFQALVGIAHSSEAEEESEKKISKRDTYQSSPSYSASTEYSSTPAYSAPATYSAPAAYPSYPTAQYASPTYAYPTPTYAAPVMYESMPQPYYYSQPQTYCSYSYKDPSIQPPECSSTDQPLGGTSTSKNCTCTYTSSPPGCTLRMCIAADVTNTACNAFRCICTATAKPSYCVQVLDYPEDAKVNFTPTPAGTTTTTTTTAGLQHATMNSLMKQAILQEAQREKILALAKQSQVANSLSNQDQLVQALTAMKQNQLLEAATSNNMLSAVQPSSMLQLVNADNFALAKPQEQLFAVIQPGSSQNIQAVGVEENQQDSGLLGGLLNLGR